MLLEKSLAAASRWPDDLSLSFNLSAKDIATSQSVMRLVTTIMASGFDPRRLDLEITETAIMHDFEQAHEAIFTLKSLGCGISLDDFGQGQTSLGYLSRLPLRELKIDRAFVTDMARDEPHAAIVRSVVELAHNLGLRVVAEGVQKVRPGMQVNPKPFGGEAKGR